MSKVCAFGLSFLIVVGWVGWAQDGKSKLELVRTFKGHNDPVYAVAFTPDGKNLVSGSFDNSVKLWDFESGQAKKTYGGPNGHNKLVTCLALSADGQSVASGGADNTVKVWDLPTNAPLRRFEAPGEVTALALSADGAKLALGTKDGKTIVVSPGDFKELAKFEGHVGPVTTLGFSGNGNQLVSGGGDQTLRVLDLAKNQLVAAVGAHRGGVASAFFNPQGGILTSGADGQLKQWAIPLLAGKPLPTNAMPVLASVLSNDGQLLVTYSKDKSLRLLSAQSGKEVRTFAEVPGDLTQLAINSNNALLAGAGSDGRWHLWNAGDGKLVGSLAGHKGGVESLAFHQQAPQLATGGSDGLIKLWSLAKLPPKEGMEADKTIEAHTGGVRWLQYHNSGQQLLSGGVDKTVRLWDIAKAAEIKKFGPFDSVPSYVAFQRDFNQVGVAVGKTLKFINLADGKEGPVLEHPAEVVSFSSMSNKTRLATVCKDKQVRLWDPAKAQELCFYAFPDVPQNAYYDANGTTIAIVIGTGGTIETPFFQKLATVEAGPVQQLILTPNNASLVTVGSEQTAKQWSLGNFGLEKSYPKLAGPLQTVAISKNNVLLAVGGKDKTITLFTTTDGKEAGKYQADAPIKRLLFSANNLLLLALLENHQVLALNVNFTPNQPTPPEFLTVAQAFSMPEGIHDIVLSPDSATFYTGGADKSLKAWKVASPNPARNFQLPNIVDSVGFHPQGNLLATGCHDGRVRLYDLAKNTLAKEIAAHVDAKNNNQTFPVYVTVFDAEGKKLLTCSSDKTLKLYDVPAGNLIKEFKAYHEKDFPKGHQEDIYAAALSPDGKWIASGSGGVENVIKIWNAGDGSVVRDLPHPEMKAPGPKEPIPSAPGRINQLAFTKDGKYLLSIGNAPGNRGFFAVWDFTEGKMLLGETLPLGAMYGLAQSADEKWIALATGNNGRPAGDHNVIRLFKNPMK